MTSDDFEETLRIILKFHRIYLLAFFVFCSVFSLTNNFLPCNSETANKN